MEINISKKHYKVIIKALQTSSFIYGPMSDLVDKKYKKDNTDIDDVLEELLSHAKSFDFGKNIEEFDNEYTPSATHRGITWNKLCLSMCRSKAPRYLPLTSSVRKQKCHHFCFSHSTSLINLLLMKNTSKKY